MFARVLMEPRRMRLNSLDTWRGLVIFLMMLDHVRDFLNRGALTSTPTEASHTTVLLYLTRWITHLCAPTSRGWKGPWANLVARPRNLTTICNPRLKATLPIRPGRGRKEPHP